MSLHHRILSGLVTLVVSLAFCGTELSAEQPNVLFIAVDDLNHWVGHLERNRQTITPHIDRLAKLGVSFSNAQCAAPVCNPSRAALLSGKRPGTSGIYDNGQPFADTLKPDESLVMQFKNAGYDTLGIGKLWHGGLGWKEQWTHIEEESKSSAKIDKQDVGGIAFGPIQSNDDATVSDTSIANYGIAELSKKHERPFFLTLGFHKPHMPWNVPQKYFDMHPLEKIELPPVQAGDLDDVPEAGKKFAKPGGDHAQILASGKWKNAVQAYLATITYLDVQIGRVLDAYEASPERDNTIICFWGDHGWHLGEKQHWRKFALWEEAARAPMIWVVPGVTPKSGAICSRPVDFMSIYPTLCDLAGIPKPTWVEGNNIRPLLLDPASNWNGVGITTYHLNNHSLRDERWRYIRYADGSEEMYDHHSDPYEWSNLASKPEHAAVKERLAALLPKQNAPEQPNAAQAATTDSERGAKKKRKAEDKKK